MSRKPQEGARPEISARAPLWLLLGGVSALALSSGALAQTKTSQVSVEEVVVTGSRIVRDGYEAPTPVTVASTEQLLRAQPQSLSQGLIQLPQFQGSLTRSTNPNIGSNVSGTHGAFLELRNLGVNRTLVLFNGRRLPPSTARGEVDVSLLPEALIQRVEVTTGGASAVYGSDAVTGVVNFVLNDKFQGMKLEAQGGVSTYNDARHYRIGGAFGRSLMDGRAHVMGSVDYFNAQGITRADRPGYADLEWGFIPSNPNAPASTIGTAANPFVISTGVRTNQPQSINGVFNTGPAGVVNMTFDSAGRLVPFDAGRPTGRTGITIGGQGTNSPNYRTHLVSPQETLQAFARFSYDVSPDITASLEATYGKVNSDANQSGPVTMRNVLVFAENPFLPASVRSALTASGLDSVRYSKVMMETYSMVGRERGDALILTAALNGRVFDDWKFDLFFTHGKSKQDNYFTSVLNQHLFAAVDAVVDPASGRVVCRVTLTNPNTLDAPCVPLNPFGPSGTVTPQMADYLVGHPEYWVSNTEDNGGFSIQGEPLSTPAGPISVSAGAEWRRTKLNQESNSDPNVLPNFTGIRFGGSARERLTYFGGSITPARGSVSVKELFGETVIPLLRDVPLAGNLELSAAGRITDYSTSGTVKTWKVGLSDQVFQDLRLRATYSRDIRAANLFELFSGRVQGTGAPLDPHCNCTGPNPGVFGGGNPDLQPEDGKTRSVGVVYQPSWLPRFSISADFYDIRIKGAIATPSADVILASCEQAGGVGPSCALITRPFPFSNRTPQNYPLEILTPVRNMSFLANRGVDIEMSYSVALDSFWSSMSGDLGARLLANYVDSYRTQLDNLSPVIELAGTRPTALGAIPLPKWKVNFALTYSNGPLRLFAQARYIGKMRNQGATPAQIYIPENTASVTYFDTTVTYSHKFSGIDTETYFTINNLLNKKPPVAPNDLVSVNFPTVTTHDIIGRFFTLGFRLRM